MNNKPTFPVVDQLMAYWVGAGVKFRSAASLDSIKEFEARYGVTMSDEIRNYFLTFDGLEDEEWDNDMISFWSLQRIGSVQEILGHRGGIPDYRGIQNHLPDSSCYFVFADYSCFSHVYAFRLNATSEDKSPVIWIGNGKTFCHLADSFTSFIRRYLISPGDLNNAVLTLPSSTPGKLD